MSALDGTLEAAIDDLAAHSFIDSDEERKLCEELKQLRAGHELHVQHGEALKAGDFLRAWTLRARMIEHACQLAGIPVPSDPDVQRCECGWRLPKDFVCSYTPAKGSAPATITVVCPSCETVHKHSDTGLRHVRGGADG